MLYIFLSESPEICLISIAAVIVVSSMCTVFHIQYKSYHFSMSPLEVLDKLTDQPKQLLRVLICWFSKFDLDKRKTG